MTDKNKRIECRPQLWFVWRALAMMALFLGFGVYFCYDALEGYPQKNKKYFLYQTFIQAGEAYQQLAKEGAESSWVSFVRDKQIPAQPEYAGVVAMDWPEELKNPLLMKEGWNKAWTVYTERTKQGIVAPEKPYDEGKIFEQWVASGVCLVLFVVTLFFFVRTLRRRMIFEDGVVSVQGQYFTVPEIVSIDMRPWKLKGLAFLRIQDKSGKSKKLRVDGLTYGGFKAGVSGSASEFMESILSLYEGDVIEYEEEEPATGEEERGG